MLEHLGEDADMVAMLGICMGVMFCLMVVLICVERKGVRNLRDQTITNGARGCLERVGLENVL